MKQTIKIEVPDGKKAVWKDNNIVFEDIKPPLPKTWEEFCKQNKINEGEYYLDISSHAIEALTSKRDKYTDKNILPSKQAAEQHLALMQLHQLRDCYRQGWTPDLADGSGKYCIERYYNSLREIEYQVNNLFYTSTFLSFPTYEMAEEFLNNFKDLIEQAGDLI